MNARRLLLSASASIALSTSCATLAPPAPTAAAAASEPAHVGMSLREATQLVQAFEAQQASTTRRVPAPTTLDEALAVLKSDRLDAFPDTVAWLTSQNTLEAQALRAQILLAWGEAELGVAELLGTTANRLEEHVRALQMRRLDAAQTAELEDEKARVELYRRTDEALRMLAAEHVAVGVDEANVVITARPDDYVGYRIAADAHRLRNEWPQFSAMLLKVEERNPESNGLIFLRGVAAQMRDGDAVEASKFYRQALANDPQFVRAQAQLVLAQPNVFAQREELEKLRALSPEHQIVRWAAPGIEQAHREAQARQQAAQNALQGRPTAPSNPLNVN